MEQPAQQKEDEMDKKIEDLVGRAREALQQAKNQGKDQVCVWLPPNEEES